MLFETDNRVLSNIWSSHGERGAFFFSLLCLFIPIVDAVVCCCCFFFVHVHFHLCYGIVTLNVRSHIKQFQTYCLCEDCARNVQLEKNRRMPEIGN